MLGLSLQDGANFATIVTWPLAVAGVYFAVWQTRKSRASQLEAVARGQYQDFLKLCMEYPNFAAPGNMVDAASLTFEGNTGRFFEYEWFFTIASNVLEAIYLSVGDQKCWDATIANSLREHKSYILSERYDRTQRENADESFQRFMDEAVHSAKTYARGTV